MAKKKNSKNVAPVQIPEPLSPDPIEAGIFECVNEGMMSICRSADGELRFALTVKGVRHVEAMIAAPKPT